MTLDHARILSRKMLLVVAAIAALSTAVWQTPWHRVYAQSAKAAKAAKPGRVDWAVYNGSPGGAHYVALDQINTANVAKLEPAWSFDTGETGGLETNPLIIDGVMYAYTPSQQVIAVDATDGKLIWRFKSGAENTRPQRGLTYWSQGDEHRLFAGQSNFIYALDPKTGQPIQAFGDHGRIDLREGLGRDPATQSLSITSPGAIFRDLLIVGSATPESTPAPPGDIRAYDVHTGRMRWSFHTIPHPGEFGYDTWPPDSWKNNGAANNWCGLSIDTERGIVYVPTGSAATDWYGGDRAGDDLFANTLLALDASTGKRLWHFQTTHHDLWDRDLPSPPTLVTVQREGKPVPAVVQATKQGLLFVFDRVTGAPLFPIAERPFAGSDVPGEVASKTQPIPLKPAPYARQAMTANDLTDRTPEAHAAALKHFADVISRGQYTPNSVGKDTVMFPGWDGGAEWGGSAFDPDTHILYLNANDVGLTESLVKQESGNGGRATYMAQCAVCHGADRKGSPPTFPSLEGVQEKLSEAQIMAMIHDGKGRMPPLPGLDDAQRKSVADFLFNGDQTVAASGGKPAYNTTGYKRFLDPEGYPGVKPPWGTLNAINLDTGEYVWKTTLGQYPELAAKGLPDTGSENYGGPVLTSGGVVFIAATVLDKKIRAFDKKTGKLLWEATLPFPANATPAVYAVNGREYVVIAAGGGRDPKVPTGGVYVAFALPKTR